jgi:hypothetical protein
MSPDEPEVVEGELVRYEPPTALLTLFGTSDPRTALARMADVATALVDVIEKKKLYATVSGRRHITAEGWGTLGGMLGIAAVVTDVRENEAGDGFVAKVEARRVSDGMVVGAAEGECSRSERTWKSRDSFALRSMAQTRGISRALRGPLGAIVALSGYDPAGAEEMPQEQASERNLRPSGAGVIPDAVKPTDKQLEEIKTLLRTLHAIDPARDWRAFCVQVTGAPWTHTTRTMAGMLVDRLQEELEKLALGEETPAL